MSVHVPYGAPNILHLLLTESTSKTHTHTRLLTLKHHFPCLLCAAKPSSNRSQAFGDISLLLFPAYNAFLNKLQTVPVVYVPTLGTPQPGKLLSSSLKVAMNVSCTQPVISFPL